MAGAAALPVTVEPQGAPGRAELQVFPARVSYGPLLGDGAKEDWLTFRMHFFVDYNGQGRTGTVMALLARPWAWDGSRCESGPSLRSVTCLEVKTGFEGREPWRE